MTIQAQFAIAWLLLPTCFGIPAYAADTTAGSSAAGVSKPIVVIPVVPGGSMEVQKPGAPESQRETDEPRAARKPPEPRDPTRGMYDPHTEREGDSRTLDQLSRDRLNLEGKRSRSLDELSSPLRERRHIDQSRGRLGEPEERTYGTPSLRERLSVPDSRREYRIDSTQDLREYIEENGSSDFRVYRSR